MTAIISDCGKYRYRLERRLPEVPVHSSAIFAGKTIAFFGINPSTADARLDDATVRKWTGFCLHWGASKFIVGNVFPFRATDVKELGRCESPIGDFITHAEHMKQIALDADILVPCWGNTTKVPKELRGRFAATLRALRGTGKPVMHFGLTKAGDPMHPLMLSYATKLQPWAAADGGLSPQVGDKGDGNG